MRKFLVISIAMNMLFSTLYAQQVRELEINYIAHDHHTESLLRVVDEKYRMSTANRQTYLYLSNADTPIILDCNRSDEQSFEEFRFKITSQVKHNVWPEVDIKRLLGLLQEDDFIDEDGKQKYDYVSLNFYITSSFWTIKYNETLIGRLLWNLDIEKMNNINVSIFYPENEELDYNDEFLLGHKKLEGAYQLFMFTY